MRELILNCIVKIFKWIGEQLVRFGRWFRAISMWLPDSIMLVLAFGALLGVVIELYRLA